MPSKTFLEFIEYVGINIGNPRIWVWFIGLHFGQLFRLVIYGLLCHCLHISLRSYTYYSVETTGRSWAIFFFLVLNHILNIMSSPPSLLLSTFWPSRQQLEIRLILPIHLSFWKLTLSKYNRHRVKWVVTSPLMREDNALLSLQN